MGRGGGEKHILGLKRFERDLLSFTRYTKHTRIRKINELKIEIERILRRHFWLVMVYSVLATGHYWEQTNKKDPWSEAACLYVLPEH